MGYKLNFQSPVLIIPTPDGSASVKVTMARDNAGKSDTKRVNIIK
jgi:hypothetical protein